MAGEGGIIFYRRGKTVASFAWGLGEKTNNEAEWLVLYFRVNLEKQLNIMDIIILDNSKHVIHQMIKGSCKSVIKTKGLHDCIHQVTTQIQVSYFHILRGNNSKADMMANTGAKREMGNRNEWHN